MLTVASEDTTGTLTEHRVLLSGQSSGPVVMLLFSVFSEQIQQSKSSPFLEHDTHLHNGL